jgi:hypothetical protein
MLAGLQIEHINTSHTGPNKSESPTLRYSDALK